MSAICLELPGAVRALSGNHADFRVRKRVFAWFLNDHHGDGIVSVCVKAAAGENVERIRRDPRRYYMPAYVGPRGWVAYRLDAGDVDWEDVKEMVTDSYRLTAPRTLVRTLPPDS